MTKDDLRGLKALRDRARVTGLSDHVHDYQFLLVAADPLAHIDALTAQLPNGMDTCTIVFRQCEKGHGWLTATNWVYFNCPTCRNDVLTAERDEWKEAYHGTDHAQMYEEWQAERTTVVETIDALKAKLAEAEAASRR